MTEDMIALPGLVDQVEDKLVENGTHDFKCVSAAKKFLGAAELPTISLVLVVEDEADIEAVFHTVWLPKDSDTAEQISKSQKTLKRVLAAFDVEYDEDGQFQVSDFVGKTAVNIRSRQVEDKREDHAGEMNIRLNFPKFAD